MSVKKDMVINEIIESEKAIDKIKNVAGLLKKEVEKNFPDVFDFDNEVDYLVYLDAINDVDNLFTFMRHNFLPILVENYIKFTNNNDEIQAQAETINNYLKGYMVYQNSNYQLLFKFLKEIKADSIISIEFIEENSKYEIYKLYFFHKTIELPTVAKFKVYSKKYLSDDNQYYKNINEEIQRVLNKEVDFLAEKNEDFKEYIQNNKNIMIMTSTNKNIQELMKYGVENKMRIDIKGYKG